MSEANRHEWQQIYAGCHCATYYHSPEWYEVWSRSCPGTRMGAKLLRFDDGVAALFPYTFTTGASGIAHYRSSPAGTYGGWLSNAALTPAHVDLLLAEARRIFPNLTCHVNPFDPAVVERVRLNQPDETHILDLSEGFEAVHRRGARGHISSENKAARAGVTVRYTTVKEDWLRYFDVYQESLRRWGDRATSRYPWTVFENLWALNSDSVRLWIAEYEGSIAAGALCVYAHRHVGYWHGSSSEKLFNVRPVQLLMYTIIRDACERGFTYFDFNPSGGHEGVREFKVRFGATPLRCGTLAWESLAARCVRRVQTLIGAS